MAAAHGGGVTAADRLERPCLVEHLTDPLPNLKDAHDFSRIAEVATKHVCDLQAKVQQAAESEESAAIGQMEHNPHSLCTESQFTFTLPPTVTSVHIRFRMIVDGKKESWENPLTWNSGYFFSPRLRGSGGALAVPPPVLLSAEWEKANIERKVNARAQASGQVEGQPRLFTLSGLTPSVNTVGWSGWLMGKAGQGLYGTRIVEVEFALATGQPWEDAEWGVPQSLQYHLPSVDAMKAMLTIALNWGRSDGVQQMQEALTEEFGTKNRKANLQMIRDFVQDMYEKLTPVWYGTIEPWIAQNPTLGILVAERRSEMLRHRIIAFLEFLKAHHLIKTIPPALLIKRPKLLSLLCSSNDTVVDITGWVELPQGDSLTFTAEAKPIIKSADAMKLWWVVPSTNEPGLDMVTLLGDAHDMRTGPGGKVRFSSLSVVGGNDVSRSVLELPGQNKWGSPSMEVGTELVVRVVVEEPEAQEDDWKDVRVRVVRRRAESGAGVVPVLDETAIDCPRDAEAPCRRTAPRVWGITKPQAIMADYFEVYLQQGWTTMDAVRAALEAAGYKPTPADLAEVAAAVGDAGDAALRAERFAAWYNDSVFGRTLLGEGWCQVQDTIRCRRNRLLKETLEIPPERWGFTEDEWGGIVPELGLMQQHAACVAKRHLASVWASRDNPTQPQPPHNVQARVENQAAPPSQPPPLPPLRLEESEDVDRATLLAVSEAFASAMAKNYLSRLLPTTSFHDEQRREWVDAAVQDQTLFGSVEQVAAFRMAEYYRSTKSEETKAARDVADEAAAAREAAAVDWMEDWRKGGAAVGPPPDGIELVEVAKVLAKTAVKQEVSRFMEVQLVPMVSTQLTEHVLPALGKSLREWVVGYCCKHWFRVGLAMIVGTSMTTACALGPWVAVYVLFRRQKLLR